MPITAQYYNMPLRDGVKLATLVVRPDEKGAYPFIVIRSPYGGGRGGLTEDVLEFCENGLGFIVQEARGTGFSEGTADLWRQEKQDAEDFLNWISEQPWFNGRLVTNGESYPGFTQWHAARNAHPVMVGLTPHNAPLDIYHGSYFSGGAYGMGLGCGWAFGMFASRNKLTTTKSWKQLPFEVPLKELDMALYGKRWDLWRQWMAHPDFDSFWKDADGFQDMEKITAPAFITGGWYDLFLMQTLRAFSEIRKKAASPEARNYSRLVLEPLDHDMRTAEVDYGDSYLDGIIATRNRFMKNILLQPDQDPLPGHAPLRFFVMGSNQWMEADEWPLPQAEMQNWYLHGQSPQNTANGKGVLSQAMPEESEWTDSFIYDPMNPVPTAGGNNLTYLPSGQRIQTEVEKRSDVLVYTSEPLEQELTVVGNIKCVLFASTDALDTDWTAKLCVVNPDGSSYNLCDGLIRARYRNTFERQEFLAPDCIHEFEIDCWATAFVFKKGTRIRIQISSSNYPRYDRNLNTGQVFAETSEVYVASQKVYHTPVYPSRLILPVIPRDAAQELVKRAMR